MSDQLLPDFSAEWDAQNRPVAGAAEKLPAPLVEPQPHPDAPSTEGMDAGEIAVDTLYRGTLGGFNKAVRGTLETVGSLVPGVDAQALKETVAPIDPPKLFLNKFQRDIVQFGLGFVGGVKILEGVGVAKALAPVATEILGSGVGTGIVADSTEARLSNLIEEYPFLSNPVTAYLQAKPGDGSADGKFKAALEDMMTTPFALVIFKGVKSLRDALSPQDVEETITAVKQLDAGAEKAPAAVVPEVKVTAPKLALTEAEAQAEKQRLLSQSEDGGNGAKMAEPDAVDAGKIATKGFTDEQKASLHTNLDEIARTGGLPDEIAERMPELFNTSRMDSPIPAKQTIHAVAQEIKDDISNLTTVQTHRQVEAAADFLNERPDVLLGNLARQSAVAEDMVATVTAAKGWMQGQAVAIYKLVQKQRMGMGAPDDPATIERMSAELSEVIRMTKTVQISAARTTSAGQITTEAVEQTGDTTAAMFRAIADEAGDPKQKEAFLKLADKIAMTEGDPKKVVSILEKVVDTHNEIFINGILSGLKTHEINVLSAAIQTLKQPLDIIAGGFIRRDADAIQQGVALYRGLRASIYDSFEMSRLALKSEMSILDPGKGTVEGAGEHYAISAGNYGLDSDGWAGHGINWLGKIVRISSRFMKGEDEFFKQMNYRAHVHVKAENEAESLVRNGILSETKQVEWTTWRGEKITLSEKEAWVRQKVEDSFTANRLNVDPKAPTYNLLAQGTDKDALNYARQATFTQDLHVETWAGWPSSGELVQRMAAVPWMRGTLLPFVKVPTNLFRAGIDSTPAAVLRAQFHADIKAGGALAASAIGRMSLGTTVLMGGGLAAFEGQITGGAPGDKELRDRKLETGWQPYSIKITDADGKTHYVSYQRLDPYMGMLFGVVADYHQIAHSVDPDVRDKLALAMTLAVAQNLSSKSYLKAVTESLAMFRGGDSSADIANRMLQMRAASYVPNWVGMMKDDDELKKVRTMLDAVMAKVPGLSSSVEAKRDYFGQKRLAADGWPWSAINPFPESESKDDPVRAELVRLGSSAAETRFTIPQETLGTLDLTKFRNERGQTAYDRWHELVGTTVLNGKTFHDALADRMQTEQYKSGTVGDAAYKLGSKAVMIRDIQEKYRDAALTAMLNEFSAEYQAGKQPVDLKQQARQDNYNKRRMKHGKDPISTLLDMNR